MLNNKFKRQLEAQEQELRDGTINEEFLKDNALESQVGGSHYKDMKIQPVVFCHENGLGICESNVIKYICRHKSKNGLEDLKKARHYIDLLISLEYTENKEVGCVFDIGQDRDFRTMHENEKQTEECIDLRIGADDE
jgi:hypothetical protein